MADTSGSIASDGATKRESIYSSLSADPDLCELVDLFVEEMPDRVENIQNLLRASNWEELRRAAHQLKGAAGSYGFTAISPFAGRLEDTIREGREEEEIRQAVDELCEMCQRARSGVPNN